MSIPDNAALSTGDIDFTVAGWVYLSSKTTSQGLIGKWDSGTTREYLIYYNTSGDSFNFGVSSNGSNLTTITASSFGSPALNTWYYVVGWHDSVNNTLNIQVNNGTTNSVSYSSGVIDSTSSFYIGQYQGGQFFTGNIDSVGLWKRVLTSPEKATLYNSGNGLEYPFVVTVPDAPTSLSANTGNAQAYLYWDPPSNTGGSSITDYIVEYKLSSEPTTWSTFSDGTSTVTYTTVTGLTNNLSYDFRVSAVNAIGTGTASGVATTTPLLLSTLLSDSFTGTTIDTAKWTEIDSIAGGTGGNVTQNGTLSVANSFVASTWGATALYSTNTFSSNGLEISAIMTPGGDQFIEYGDINFQSAGTRAYILFLTGGGVQGIAKKDGAYTSNVSCGTATSGATYKMKIITTGFQIYKNGVLQCVANPGASNLVDNKPVFLESATTASTFDDVLVYGDSATSTVPDAPTAVSATAGDAQAIVSFTAPASNGGSAITSYTVTSSPGGITGTGSTSPITVTGLTNNTAYTFIVTATNSIGTSASSSSSNSVTPTASSLQSISITNANLVWSPYNWHFNGSTSATTNPGGAYVKVAFSGTTLAIGVDTSSLGSVPASSIHIHTFIDGSTSLIDKTLANAVSNTVTISSSLSSGNHYAIIYLGITDNNVAYDRWTVPNNALKITNIKIDAAESILSLSSTPLAQKSQKIIIFGDSITEGSINIVTGSEYGYAAIMGKTYNAEYGQIGYGGQGWNRGGRGSVPAFYNATTPGLASWRSYDSTATRLVDVNDLSAGFIGGNPDAVFVNMGTNDAINSVGTTLQENAIAAWLADIRLTVGNTAKIFIISPFDFGNTGSSTYAPYKTSLLAGINDYKLADPADNKVYILDLGMPGYNTVVANSSDSLHPNNTGSALLGNQLAALAVSTSTFTTSPSTTVQDSTAVTITLTGTGTAWTTGTPGTPTFLLSGGTGASITAQTITSSTSATLTINAGSAVTTLTIADPTNNSTTTVSVTSSDIIPPVISLTTPSVGTVSGPSVTVSASASDNAVVIGVQFKLDGSNLQAEDIVSPYVISWDTTTVADGIHTLTAVARDAAGNSTTTSSTSVTVDNTPPSLSLGSPSGSLASSTTSTTLSITTDESSTCKYDTTPSTLYASMSHTFDTTGGTSHTSSLTSLTSGTSYSYYIRCIDASSNANTSDYTISFSVDALSTIPHINITSIGYNPSFLPGLLFPITNSTNSTNSTDTTACRRGDSFSMTTGARCTPTTPYTPPSSFIFTRSLSWHDTGDDVRSLQHYLNTHNTPVAPSGVGSLNHETTYFGLATRAAVMAFQKANGLVDDGVVGPITRKVIESVERQN